MPSWVARQKTSAATAGARAGVFNLYNASVNVAYTPDVFGATRRTLEGAQAAVDYQRFQVEATYLALSANVVTGDPGSVAARAAEGHARSAGCADAPARRDREAVRIWRGAARHRAQPAQPGGAGGGHGGAAGKGAGGGAHQLSVLAGKLPGEAGMPQFALESLTLPEQLPVSLPSALVRQRPDIRASEEALHQASAAIGVATAAQYPQFTLSGSYGSSAIASASCLNPIPRPGIWRPASRSRFSTAAH
jgi:hypothetical protein